jgi:DNA (cytosine-5)-methyltransferase 1
MTLRIASLFSGYGGLDEGVRAVLGGELVWFCQYDPEDKNQYAARILAHHWPEVPNLGDITGVCWQCVLDQYGPVDVLTGGFPCTDLSLAGKRAGIAEGTRSGLWLHMARAIEVLRPRLVVIENVRGILSQKADRGMEPRAEDLDRTGGAALVLRALGAVLGDLAGLGFDAEWAGFRAEEVRAPHERFREFILGFPRDAAADSDDEGTQRAGQAGRSPERHTAGEGCSAADAAGEGLQGGRVRGRAAGRREAAEDTDGAARGERRFPAPGQAEGWGARADAGRRGGAPVAGRGGRSDAVEPDCPTCGCPESFHDAGGFCAGCHGCTDPELGRLSEAAADPDGNALREQPVSEPGSGGSPLPGQFGPDAAADTEGDGRHEGRGVADVGDGPASRGGDGEPRRGGTERVADGVTDWGDYADAIARWETAIGRPAPRPTDDRGRLSPAFVEWMMGLPAGHVTGVPGLPRSAQLKALGNGVVPQQAAAALRHLLERAQIRIAA